MKLSEVKPGVLFCFKAQIGLADLRAWIRIENIFVQDPLAVIKCATAVDVNNGALAFFDKDLEVEEVECCGFIPPFHGEFDHAKADRENHAERHKFLHGCLDELVADWMLQTGKRATVDAVDALMIWSHDQCQNPTEPGPVVPQVDIPCPVPALPMHRGFTPQEMMQMDKAREEGFPEFVEVWLKLKLAGGERLASDLIGEAEAVGISERQLKTARHSLHLPAEYRGKELGWAWSLPVKTA